MIKGVEHSLTKILIANLQAIDIAVANWLRLQKALIDYRGGGDGAMFFVGHESVIKSHCNVLSQFVRSRKNDLDDDQIEWLLQSIFVRILDRVRKSIVDNSKRNFSQIYTGSNTIAVSCGKREDLVWSVYRRTYVIADPLVLLAFELSVVKNSRVILHHADLPRRTRMTLVK